MSFISALKKLVKSVEVKIERDNVSVSVPTLTTEEKIEKKQNYGMSWYEKKPSPRKRVRVKRHITTKAKVKPTNTIHFVKKGGERNMSTPAINQCRELLDQVLTLLREEQKNAGATLRGRDLALALTYLEDGCMRMIRSEHADKPYSPMLKLKEEKPVETPAPETPAQTPTEQAPAASASPDTTTPANQPAPEGAQPGQNQQSAPAESQPANPAPSDQPAATPAETPQA